MHGDSKIGDSDWLERGHVLRKQAHEANFGIDGNFHVGEFCFQNNQVFRQYIQIKGTIVCIHNETWT